MDAIDVLIWMVKHPWFLLTLALLGLLLQFFMPETGTKPVPDAVPTEVLAEETPGDLEDEQIYQDSGFIFPDSGTESISQQEIKNLSDSDLTYAINEIYARHGYIFRSDELRGYYEQFSWYTGTVPANEFSVDCFSQIEQQNWNLLVNERNRRKSSD